MSLGRGDLQFLARLIDEVGLKNADIAEDLCDRIGKYAESKLIGFDWIKWVAACYERRQPK